MIKQILFPKYNINFFGYIYNCINAVMLHECFICYLVPVIVYDSSGIFNSVFMDRLDQRISKYIYICIDGFLFMFLKNIKNQRAYVIIKIYLRVFRDYTYDPLHFFIQEYKKNKLINLLF